jgi:hypothetical protein
LLQYTSAGVVRPACPLAPGSSTPTAYMASSRRESNFLDQRCVFIADSCSRQTLRDRVFVQHLFARRFQQIRPGSAGKPKLELIRLKNDGHRITHFSDESVWCPNHRRTRTNQFVRIGIAPLVPQPSDCHDRPIAAREIIGLPTTGGAFPRIVAGDGNETVPAFERRTEQRSCRSHVDRRFERRGVSRSCTQHPPNRNQAPTHWPKGSPAANQPNRVDRIGRAYLVPRGHVGPRRPSGLPVEIVDFLPRVMLSESFAHPA